MPWSRRIAVPCAKRASGVIPGAARPSRRREARSRDAGLEGIKDAAARPAAARLEARTRHPRRHRLRVKAQRPGGLRDRQALAVMAVVDFAERLVIDHDRLRSQARALPPAPRM